MSNTKNSEHKIEQSFHTALKKHCFQLHTFLFHTLTKKHILYELEQKRNNAKKKGAFHYINQFHHIMLLRLHFTLLLLSQFKSNPQMYHMHLNRQKRLLLAVFITQYFVIYLIFFQPARK